MTGRLTNCQEALEVIYTKLAEAGEEVFKLLIDTATASELIEASNLYCRNSVRYLFQP